jgi:hypothetical protein
MRLDAFALPAVLAATAGVSCHRPAPLSEPIVVHVEAGRGWQSTGQFVVSGQSFTLLITAQRHSSQPPPHGPSA